MPTKEESLTWRGHELVDRDGDKIGKIEEIYLDTRDRRTRVGAGQHRPVRHEEHRSSRSRGATPERRRRARCRSRRRRSRTRPSVDADGELSQREEAELYRHYGLDYAESRSDSGLPEGGAGERRRRRASRVGRDVSGPTTDDAMTRSEEELRVGTTEREAGRARLRKYVVTEEVHADRPRRARGGPPRARADHRRQRRRATAGPDISEEEHEVVLHEEEPVVEKRAVPKERVRLETDTVQEERSVSDTVRREEVDVEGAPDRR